MRADGIYFGLDEDAHRDDPALGSTDHKDIIYSPVQWQAKRQHQLMSDLDIDLTDDAEAAAKLDRKRAAGRLFGSAIHTIILDGQEAFDAKYFVPAEQPEGLLKTKEQIGGALEPFGVKLASAVKLAEYVMTARAHGLPLHEDWLQEQDALAAGREPMSRRWAAMIRLIGTLLDTQRPDHGGKSIRERYMSGGYPEVSVFWTTPDGVRCKARFDYLRIKAIIDVKTYRAMPGMETVAAFCRAVGSYAYDMQAAHYIEARAQVRDFIRDGKVFGDVDPAWLDKLAAYEGEVTWSWLAVQTAGLPEIDVIELPANGLVFSAAQRQVETARGLYRTYADHFGPDELWVNQRGLVILDDIMFSQQITSRGDERWRAPQ